MIKTVYYIAAGASYACIVVICILALVYGLRARAYVKHEKITALPRGFSPLDVQRIFIGKTYPRKLTRALIVHWAQLGYIRVAQVGRNTVRLKLINTPPYHTHKDAAFFDRGTYVRERDLFTELFGDGGAEITVNVKKPLFTRKTVKKINKSYAAREDEGVYSSKHYKLKVFTFALSVLPFLFCGLYVCAAGSFVGALLPFLMIVGMFVLRFMLEIPFVFRLIWSDGFVLTSVVLMVVSVNGAFDPFGLAYSSVAALFIGSFILIRFVDHREKNNLSDYSDFVNYKKFLLYSRGKELEGINYYDALPFIYAYGIKPFVKRKFSSSVPPEWYSDETGKGGTLL